MYLPSKTMQTTLKEPVFPYCVTLLPRRHAKQSRNPAGVSGSSSEGPWKNFVILCYSYLSFQVQQ